MCRAFLYFALMILMLSPVFETGQLSAAQIKQFDAKDIPASLLQRHYKFPDCTRFDSGIMSNEDVMFTVKLDENTQLYAIACEPAPYNFSYVFYTVSWKDFSEAERMYFPGYSRARGWYGRTRLYNAYYDAKTKLLHSFSKSRGSGDCGSQSKFRWTQDGMALVEFRLKERCDGDISRGFPLIYRRPVK